MQNLFNKFLAKFFSTEESVFFGFFLLLSISFVYFFGNILLPVLVSLILAFLLNGLIRSLESFGLSSKFSLFLTLTVFLSLYLSLFLTLPSIGSQINELIQSLPAIVVSFQETVTKFFQSYSDKVSADDIKLIFSNISSQLNTFLSQALGQIATTVSFMFNAIFVVILIPLMVFFFLKDKQYLLPMLTNLLPKERGLMNAIFTEMNDQLFNYVTGKFIEMLIVASFSYLLFVSLGLPYAVLLSILVGLSVIIPIFGAILVTVPVVLVGLYEWGLTGTFYWLLGLYLLIQVLDGNFLVPLLFSSRNNLNPAIIIIAIVFFGGIWGFWGLFFAIPLATFLKAIINSWPESKQNS